jgi:hypothetical protein
MDRECTKHYAKNGKGIGDHELFWQASSLEWSVVQSFSSVEPSISVWWKQFDGWTMGELQVATYGTDDVDTTGRRLFDDAVARAKLSAYVSSFSGATIALEETKAYLPDSPVGVPISVEDVLKDWSAGIDPVTYVVLMKVRIDNMMHAIIRLKNTNNIFRSEIREAKSQVEELTKRLRYMKKTKSITAK